MKNLLILCFIIFTFSCNNLSKNEVDFTTKFEKTEGKETSEYKDIIEYYEKLADEYSQISLFYFGQTDSGKPLHLVVYSEEGIYNVEEITSSKKNRILINNGIHP
jgi:hypothetical protein